MALRCMAWHGKQHDIAPRDMARHGMAWPAARHSTALRSMARATSQCSGAQRRWQRCTARPPTMRPHLISVTSYSWSYE
eukprot:353350-Chlamydomonas_euryale.AAC.2